VALFTLLEAAAKFHAMGRDMEELTPMIVEGACKMVQTEAKRVLGTHDYGWPALAPSTIAKKAKGDTPGLETGEMKDSIQYTMSTRGNEGWVGTDNDKAVWFELGTSRQPPRSFLARAAAEQEPKIQKMASRSVASVMAGKGLQSTELRELIHFVRHVAREAKEVWKESPYGRDR
jgi:hypothetical protein